MVKEKCHKIKPYESGKGTSGKDGVELIGKKRKTKKVRQECNQNAVDMCL